jgi:hypothetical protein
VGRHDESNLSQEKFVRMARETGLPRNRDDRTYEKSAGRDFLLAWIEAIQVLPLYPPPEGENSSFEPIDVKNNANESIHLQYRFST